MLFTFLADDQLAQLAPFFTEVALAATPPEELNLARSREDQAKNLAHKVLGRRGERILRQVELRPEESVSQEGKVVVAGREERQEKRGDKKASSVMLLRRSVTEWCIISFVTRRTSKLSTDRTSFLPS